MSGMPCLHARGMSKRFLLLRQEQSVFRTLAAMAGGEPLRREFWALRDIDLPMARGERVALIGRNGSGKTTFLRLACGIYAPTAGSLTVSLRPRALFRFWTGFNGDLTVVDNIYLFGAVHGIGRRHLSGKLEGILEHAGLCDLRFSFLKNLSSGQLQKLALEVFWEGEGELMIFDESLAFVDRAFAERSEARFNALAAQGTSMLVASHDMEFVRRHCTRAVWLEEGRIRMDDTAERTVEAYERHTDTV